MAKIHSFLPQALWELCNHSLAEARAVTSKVIISLLLLHLPWLGNFLLMRALGGNPFKTASICIFSNL